jgi:hypothetical protein
MINRRGRRRGSRKRACQSRAPNLTVHWPTERGRAVGGLGPLLWRGPAVQAPTRLRPTRLGPTRLGPTRLGPSRFRPCRLGLNLLGPTWTAPNRFGAEGLRPCRPGVPRSGRPRLVPWTSVAPWRTSSRADTRPGVARSYPPRAVRVGRVRHTCRLAVGPSTQCLPRATCASRPIRTSASRRLGRPPSAACRGWFPRVVGGCTADCACRPTRRVSAGRRGVASALGRLLRRTGLAEILDPVVVGVARSVGGRELVPVAARLPPEPTTLLTIGLLAATLRVAHGSYGERPARMVGPEHRSDGDPGIGFGGNTPTDRTGWPGVLVVGVGPPQITVLRPSRCHKDCYSRD